MTDGERSLAIFVDFENLALGFQGRRDRFDITRVLERLVEKGKIVAKKAYADWSRFGMYTAPLHEAAIELVEIPRCGHFDLIDPSSAAFKQVTATALAAAG